MRASAMGFVFLDERGEEGALSAEAWWISKKAERERHVSVTCASKSCPYVLKRHRLSPKSLPPIYASGSDTDGFPD